MNNFLLKTDSVIINRLPLSFIHTILEILAPQSNKIWKQGEFGNQPVCMKSSLIRRQCLLNDKNPLNFVWKHQVFCYEMAKNPFKNFFHDWSLF